MAASADDEAAAADLAHSTTRGFNVTIATFMYERSSKSHAVFAVVALAVIAGVILRVYAALGDFWLDEIWSLVMSQQAKSLLDVLHFKVDNNHALNTMLMRLIGDQAYWPLYRVPSIVAGGASIALAGLIARRWNAPAATFAMISVALSYPLVLYGSEARGYSLAVMFMLLATWTQLRMIAPTDVTVRASVTSRIATLVTFWLACMLGMLAHPLFLQPFLALLAWATCHAMTIRGHPAAARVGRLVSQHLPPVAFAALLYAAHWRGMRVAGGETSTYAQAINRALALMLGAHGQTPAMTTFFAAVAAALVILALIWLIRRRDALALFAMLVIVIVPSVMLMVLRPTVLYERYFLLPMTIALLVIAGWLGTLVHLHKAKALAAVLLLAAFGMANLTRDARLIDVGRGHYLEAMEFIAAHTAGPEIVIGSDHDFRNQMTIDYYTRFIDKPVRYIATEHWIGSDGQWFIVHGPESEREPAIDVTDMAGVKWKRVASYDSNALSGFRWFIYQRVSP